MTEGLREATAALIERRINDVKAEQTDVHEQQLILKERAAGLISRRSELEDLLEAVRKEF